MSNYYERQAREEYVRNPSHRGGDPPPASRDYSPDYQSGGGGPLIYHQGRGAVPVTGPYVSGAIPVDALPARPHYEPGSPLSPRDKSALEVPLPHRYRPQSLPPQALAVARSHSRSWSRSRSRSRSPLGKARHTINQTFTQSSSGLGVGLLGAVVGGLAAREVSDATVRSRNRKEMENGTYRLRSSQETEKARVISTVVGAIVGGLGANALERRFEVARERDRDQQEAWERKWGKERDLPHYDTGKKHERDHGRGRPRMMRHDDWNATYPRDYVYDNQHPGRLRSEERYP